MNSSAFARPFIPQFMTLTAQRNPRQESQFLQLFVSEEEDDVPWAESDPVGDETLPEGGESFVANSLRQAIQRTVVKFVCGTGSRRNAT